MCGGFTCSKNALTALNIMYIIVSFILIGVAAYGHAASIVTSITIFGGVIACGVFLFLLSLLGLIGAIKHHQVLLFFYMIILFLLFIIQFSVACACLAMSSDQQHELALEGWNRSPNHIKEEAENFFNCCGFDSNNETCIGSPKCCTLPTGEKNCSVNCRSCWPELHKAIGKGLKITGGIGLFFSFTEFIGVWLTVRYRNQKDPRANPSAFL